MTTYNIGSGSRSRQKVPSGISVHIPVASRGEATRRTLFRTADLLCKTTRCVTAAAVGVPQAVTYPVPVPGTRQTTNLNWHVPHHWPLNSSSRGVTAVINRTEYVNSQYEGLPFSLFQCIGVTRSWHMYIYVVPVIAQHNGVALYYCRLQRSGLCRSSATTELVSRVKKQRGHWVNCMSTSRKNGSMSRTHTYNQSRNPTRKPVPGTILINKTRNAG